MRPVITSLFIIAAMTLFICTAKAQDAAETNSTVYRVRTEIYEGERIPSIRLKTVYIYAPIKFKNKRDMRAYYKLIRDVKKTLPIARTVRGLIIETYEILQTIDDEKEKARYIKQVERGIKKQYTPQMKKLTFSQGKLLIKLIDRECNLPSYDIVKSFIGPFKAGFYQTFAALFGASLKKEYDPEGDDRLTERVILMIESGQL